MSFESKRQKMQVRQASQRKDIGFGKGKAEIVLTTFAHRSPSVHVHAVFSTHGYWIIVLDSKMDD